MSEEYSNRPRSAQSAENEEEEKLEQVRQSKVADFHLHLNLDEEFGDAAELPVMRETQEAEEPSASAPLEEPTTSDTMQFATPIAEGASSKAEPAKPSAAAANGAAPRKGKKGKDARTAVGCAGGMLYVIGVLATSMILAFFIVSGALDFLGITKSDALVDVTIPENATTAQVADILKENGLISQKLTFRLYSGLTGADDGYQSGMFTLSGTMGYKGLIEKMQALAERQTVDVTFPEGLTVLEIAQKLEDNGVCSSEDFLRTLANGDFSDYMFIKDVPQIGEGTQNPYRIYRLEGYLYPDTYTFYVGSSPESAIRKFLDNFEVRVDASVRSAIKAYGLTLDEAITLASMVQREADNRTDMEKISRVFQNRLRDENFLHLQSDPTMNYASLFFDGLDENSPIEAAYNTYVCVGLPTGPICNAGADALNAVLHPSEDEEIMNCYYFATDMDADPPVTYYSETYAQHVEICQEYGIGIYGGAE